MKRLAAPILFALILGAGAAWAPGATAAGGVAPTSAFCKQVTAYNAKYIAAYKKSPTDLKGLSAIKATALHGLAKVAPTGTSKDFDIVAKHYETGAKAGVSLMNILGVVNKQCGVDLA